MAATDTPGISEQWVVESVGGAQATTPTISEQWAILAAGQAAPYADVSEQWAIEAVGGAMAATPSVSEQWVVLVVDEQVPTTPVGAWTYKFDGHLFVGFNLGAQGTEVFDAVEGRWSKWASGALPWMNINLCVEWKGETYGASLVDESLLKFNPNNVVDEDFRANTFVASGRVEYENRGYAAIPYAQVFGSIGLAGGDVSFRYSNDDGASWSTSRTLTVAAGDRAKNVVFSDLGSLRSPGRLFEIEDNGTLKRIGALKVHTDG